MNNKEEFIDFLRNEAENLMNEVNKIETKIANIFSKQGVEALDKINKLDKRRSELNSQALKLYELIGRL